MDLRPPGLVRRSRDPATGAIGDGVEAQTEQALLNLAAVLSAAASLMGDVVETTAFYADVEDFTRLNEVYARPGPSTPARSAPAHVRLPRGLLVSIEAIAVLQARWLSFRAARSTARPSTRSRLATRRATLRARRSGHGQWGPLLALADVKRHDAPASGAASRGRWFVKPKGCREASDGLQFQGIVPARAIAAWARRSGQSPGGDDCLRGWRARERSDRAAAVSVSGYR